MERNNRNEWRDRDDAQHLNDKSAQDASDENEILSNANEDVGGNDLREEENDRVRHHQAHGIRHYESFRNHSSADDQPMTDTGA
jgi:hypothetical protein